MASHHLSGGTLARAAGIAVAYLVAAGVAVTLTREAGNIAVFWPANGLLLGALLHLPRRDHPITLAACGLTSTAANLLHGDALGLAGCLAALNILEVLCGYHAIAYLAGLPFVLTDLHKLFALLIASVVAPAISATAAALVLSASLGTSESALWWAWWSRETIGMLLFLPLVASFDAAPLGRLVFGPRDRRLLIATFELVAAFGLLVLVVALIIESETYGSPTLFTPILLWVALRLGVCPVAAAAATIGVAAATAAAYDLWPLPFTPGATVASRVLPLQLLVILVTLPPLVVAVVVAERARARRRLDDALESMADAFALYDTDDRLVLCNRRYPEFLGRIADLLVPGARYADLVREGARRGMYPAVDAAQTEAWVAEQVAAHRGGASELQLADGRWLHIIAQRTADGGTVDVRRDVTARKRLEQAIEHMAMHDPLTDLPNRTMFYRELERAQARARRDGTGMAVMLLDLDRFKEVNDTYGHAVGDLLLVETARRLAGCVRAGDLVARLGGDEFAVIAGSRSATDGFDGLARRIVERLSEPMQIGQARVRPGASVGMTIFHEHPGGPDELVAHADRALYAAKGAGRGTWAPFEDGLRDERRRPDPQDARSDTTAGVQRDQSILP